MAVKSDREKESYINSRDCFLVCVNRHVHISLRKIDLSQHDVREIVISQRNAFSEAFFGLNNQSSLISDETDSQTNFTDLNFIVQH